MKRAVFTQTSAEPLSLGVSTLLFAVLAVVIAPALSGSSIVIKAMSAAVSAVTLGTFFLVLRRIFHRAWARPLLGVWVYRTVPHDESKRSDTGYGVAEFSQNGDGTLAYRVDIYRSVDDVLAVAAQSSPSGESHGTAVGLAVSYDERTGALWILYQVQYYSDTDPDREGHLFVRAAGPAGHRVLRGSWASDLQGRELSAGTMTMTRAGDFPTYIRRGAGD